MQQVDIPDMALFTGVQNLCIFNIVAPIIYHLLSNVSNVSYTISTSIFVDVPYWPPYSTDKFISCVVLGPSQWFFHFGEEIVIAWTHIGWVWCMFNNPPLPVAQEFHTSSSGVTVTPCIFRKNDGVQYHQVSSFPPESMFYFKT